jgi:NAD(P)-dependent dehydrogenase (short-subunit alcohol dehydrogenase family)
VAVTARHQGHRNLSQSVTLAAGSNTSNLMLTATIAAGLAGSWSGSWTNTTFGSTGPAAATITADRGPLAAPPSQGGSASRRPCPRTQSSSSGTGAALAAGALARTPSGRLATLDDVADVALFLCSPFADQIVGQTLVLDGGASLLA